jgi:putative transposase
MDLGDHADRVRFMIRDRGSNFTAAFDTVLADAGTRTVLCNVRTPRMNAITERWIGGCRRELLDRALIWNQAHLLRTLRQYESHHNQHRPHHSLHHGCFKIVLGPALAVPGLPGRDVVSRSGIGSADLIMK